MARVVGSYITEINSTTALSNTGWGPGAIPAQSIGVFTGFSDFILVANMEDQNQRIEDGNTHRFEWTTDPNLASWNSFAASPSAGQLGLYNNNSSTILTNDDTRADSIGTANATQDAYNPGFKEFVTTGSLQVLPQGGEIRNERSEGAIAIDVSQASLNTRYYFRFFAEGKKGDFNLVLKSEFVKASFVGNDWLLTSQTNAPVGIAETQATVGVSSLYVGEIVGQGISAGSVGVSSLVASISEGQAIAESAVAFSVAASAESIGQAITTSLCGAELSVSAESIGVAEST
ncbi:hypothetical protein N8457_00515, partial [bacterium]|nr:hypothetical protein [bacterium]